MRLPEFARWTSFRWALGTAAAFALSTLLLFGFVYWHASVYLAANFDAVITGEINKMEEKSDAGLLESIAQRLSEDPRRIKLAGLFEADGRRLAGNIETFPPALELGAPAREVTLVRLDDRGREEQSVHAVARRLPDGRRLVVARNIDETKELAEIVGEALTIGLLPALLLAIGIGILLSHRAHRRVEEVNRRVARIVAGDLRQRLPSRGIQDPFDRLAVIVNGMLDQIEGLVQEISGVGDDIAHDLRTPLSRVRAILERGRQNAATVEEFHALLDRSITGLDQCLAIITALLRITEIEHSRRLSGFGEVVLSEMMAELEEFYAPMAEDREVTLRLLAGPRATLRGDRDLLFEAVANLVDNAVKFTPAGGRVELALRRGPGLTIIRVSDSGPGIGVAEREAVTKRFYRSDRSRHMPGIGLGLSLVAAIVRLHGFTLTISGGPGCVIEIACPDAMPHPN